MTSWSEFQAVAPELAQRARALLDLHKHKTIATLRADGSPRISGIEIEFTDSDVTLGMMPGSVKALDVARDSRVAIHGPSVGATEPDADPAVKWAGDAKFSGVLEAIPIPSVDAVDGAYFRVDLTEVVVTRVADTEDHLIIEWWTPSGGTRTRTRS